MKYFSPDNNEDVTYKNMHPMEYTIKDNHNPLIQVTAWLTTISANRPVDVSLLKQALDKYNVSSDATDVYGRTLLHLAARGNNLPAYNAITEYAPHLSLLTTDIYGNNVLQIAFLSGEEDVVYKILETNPNRALINNTNINNDTVLHMCARALFPTDNILDKCITPNNINVQNNDGKTALHIAAQNNMVKMCETLLRNGADASIKDNDGKKPKHYTTSHILGEALNGASNKHSKTCEIS